MTKTESQEPINEEQRILSLNDIDASLTYSYANYLNWLLMNFLKVSKFTANRIFEVKTLFIVLRKQAWKRGMMKL